MKPADILRQRLHNQCLEGSLRSPQDVVRWLGAVQSQDFGGAAWAVCQRGHGSTLADFHEAFARGDLLRTHVMRPTWHFVAPEDIRWLLTLTAPRLLQAAHYYFKKYQLTDAILGRTGMLISQALEGGKHLTRPEIATLLVSKNVDIRDQVHLAHIIIHAEATGLICSGVPRGKQQTYALVSERAPNAITLTREEALAELAKRYFQSHGPATLQDYTWWSGLTAADAAVGLQNSKANLISETINDQTYWFTPPISTAPHSTRVYLLPNYDEYIVAYADRSMVFDVHRYTDRLDSRQNPVFNNVIIIDGCIKGTWKPIVTRETVNIEATLFMPLQEADRQVLAKAAKLYEKYVGMPVSIVNLSSP